MRRWTLAPALALAMTAAACGSADPEEGDAAGGTAPAGSSSDDVPAVPVELSTDLVDPGGSALGTARLRESDAQLAQLEVQVAGLTAGFHGIRVIRADSCDDVPPEAPSVLLPPVLVVENGIGSLTTLVGPSSLDDLLDEGPVTVVIGEAVQGPMDGGTGSRLACGTFAD